MCNVTWRRVHITVAAMVKQ